MRKANTRRAHRLEEELMQELAKIILEKVQDPRLELVTISGVRLNKDYSVAEVLYTHSAMEERSQEVQEGLESANGYIRKLLGNKLKLRYVPELRFRWDKFLEETIYASLEKNNKRD